MMRSENYFIDAERSTIFFVAGQCNDFLCGLVHIVEGAAIATAGHSWCSVYKPQDSAHGTRSRLSWTSERTTGTSLLLTVRRTG